MSAIVKAAHGLVAGQRVVFSSLVGGVGIDPDTVYYVVPVVNVNDFQISETQGGTPITFTTVTSANMQVVPETTDTDADTPGYTAQGGTGWEAPPTVPPAPSAPTVDSLIVSGIVRLRITLNSSPEAKVRLWEIQATHKYDGSGNADWSAPQVLPLPENGTELSIPAFGSTGYTVRVRAQDVYGNFGSFSTEVQHTTIAGSDAMQTATAALANAVVDGSITESSIAPNSISTPLLQAGAVTAQILAATIVLSSLIKTANTGRRIEIDVDGIRLYDTDESLLVRIPTNGDPVFIKGQMTADSLISQVAASFRGTVDLAGNSVVTAQNGISAPSNVPTVTAGQDSLTLTGTGLPASALGLGYDSGAGTFWVACDPATGYVAYEYNATTGAFVRRIPATGSTNSFTATSGSTSHISDTAQGIDGSTNSHITTPMVMPSPAGASNMKITKVSAYFAGHNGTCSARVGVWNTSNVNLRESATFTAADEGATGLGDSHHYDQALSSPLAVTAGTTYRVGFRHTSTSEGFQFDRDDGSGKTTYSGDGSTADGTGWGTLNSASKPNVYFTYTYDVDSRLETLPMIGVCTDGSYIYTLDSGGTLWKYDRSTMAHVTHVAQAANIPGTKAKAGLFCRGGGNIVVTTTTGTGAGVYPKFVEFNSSLALVTSYSTASSGPTFSGTTDTFRGAGELNDPLNGSIFTWWVATTNGVYAYNWNGSTFTNTANRDFGLSTTTGDGLTYDGTQFWGFDSANLTKFWKFTGWDWTTSSNLLWVGYSWYDSNATGGTHETAMGPRTSLTIRRRERVQVITPAIPTGGTDDPNNVRVYFLANGTDTGAGTFWLQTTDALTARFISSFSSSTHDGAGTPFPAGVPAALQSAVTTGWKLKGDGGVQLPRDQWILSADGKNRIYFGNNDRSYAGSQNGYEWRSAADANIAELSNTGVLRTKNAWGFRRTGSASATSPLPFATVDQDSHSGGYNSTNKTWAVPTGGAGVWLITMSVVGTVTGAPTMGRGNILVNGVAVATYQDQSSGGTNVGDCAVALVPLADGDLISYSYNLVGGSSPTFSKTLTASAMRLFAGAFSA